MKYVRNYRRQTTQFLRFCREGRLESDIYCDWEELEKYNIEHVKNNIKLSVAGNNIFPCPLCEETNKEFILKVNDE